MLVRRKPRHKELTPAMVRVIRLALEAPTTYHKGFVNTSFIATRTGWHYSDQYELISKAKKIYKTDEPLAVFLERFRFLLSLPWDWSIQHNAIQTLYPAPRIQ